MKVNSGAGGEQQFYVGELPPDFVVPLPEGVRLLGSQEHKYLRINTKTDASVFYQHRSDHIRVLLDSDLAVPEFVAQMRAGLNDTWETFEWPEYRLQGFVSAEPPDAFHVYHPALRQSLHVHAAAVAGVTQVTLDLNSHEHDPRQQMHLHFAQQIQHLAVSLWVPAGTTVHSGGGGSSGNRWQSEAVLESDLSAAALLDHFADQLQVGGWKLLIRSHTDVLVAASWANASGALVFITLSSAGPTYSATMLTVQTQHEDS